MITLLPTRITDYPGGSYLPELNPAYVLRKVFPTAYCQSLTNLLDLQQSVPSLVSKPGSVGEVSKVRTSSVVTLDPSTTADFDMLIGHMVNCYTVQMLDKKAFRVDPIQFLKYEKGGRFLQHADNAYYNKGQFEYSFPRRHLSFVLFLNDEYEGGEFVLHSCVKDGKKVRFKGSIGEMLLFPSDLRYPHEVEEVTSGVRYTAVTWYELKDWRKA